MEDFKAGDVVKLKSGGPAMTIAFETAQSEYKCLWFDGKEMKFDTFPKQVLKESRADTPRLS